MPLGEANLFGLHQYDNQTSFFNGDARFSQGMGYAIVCGFGAFFAVVTTLIMQLDKKFAGSVYNSEEFNTAGRAIKTGLTTVDIVSRGTWVSTLLQSSNETFRFGITGGFWYGSAAAVQFFLFGTVALEIKRRAPKGHTVVELVRRRWGHKTGFVFLYLCYLNNFVVSALLILGAGNVLVASTGMSANAAYMLIPLSVIIYTVAGGLKATFISSYIHTVIIFVTLNVFCFTVYGSGREPIGTISKVWENLTEYARVVPVEGNKEGSYLTMFSRGGLEFGVNILAGSFGTVWADQAYWQGAIAATPEASYQGYLLGALCWLPIPFALATSLGLSARALDLPITPLEANAGLVPVAAAEYVLGSGGVILVLTMVFMAVTSAGSAEFIAMSSLFTYDIYKAYLRPKAGGSEMLFVSRCAVVVFGLLSGALSCLLHGIAVDVNFLFLVVGILVCSSVAPLTLMLMWRRVPSGAAIAGALGGQVAGVISWLVHAQSVYHELTISHSLQELGPTMSGTLVSLVASGLIILVWSLAFPDTTDSYGRFQSIEVMDGVEVLEYTKDDLERMKTYFRITLTFALVMILITCVVWPLLALPAGVFSKAYFTMWVVISILWALVASIVCTFLPLVESRGTFLQVVKGMLGLGRGRSEFTHMLDKQEERPSVLGETSLTMSTNK